MEEKYTYLKFANGTFCGMEGVFFDTAFVDLNPRVM